jgi:hypothetical protein
MTCFRSVRLSPCVELRERRETTGPCENTVVIWLTSSIDGNRQRPTMGVPICATVWRGFRGMVVGSFGLRSAISGVYNTATTVSGKNLAQERRPP